MKVCKECKIEKDFSFFYKNEKMRDGFLNQCKDCSYLKNKEKRKDYYLKNKAKVKLYLEKNKDKISKRTSEYNLKYYNENKNRILKYQKEYRINNLEKEKEYEKNYRLNNKEKRSIYHKERKQNDILYRLSHNIRNNIRIIFRSKGYTKKSKIQDILGCSFEEFKLHIESKFEPWMTWSNKGIYNGEFNYGWDIDHITPLSCAETEEDLIRLNHYTNLQPLCSKINRDIKRNNINYSRYDK